MKQTDNNISHMIYNANVMIKWKMQEALKAFEITSEQWIILRRLDKKSGELNQKKLAIQTHKEQASITRIIRKMEGRGLVRREQSQADRREYTLYITDEGHKLYQSTLPAIDKVEKEVCSMIPKERQELFADSLSDLVEELQKEL